MSVLFQVMSNSIIIIDEAVMNSPFDKFCTRCIQNTIPWGQVII